MPKANLDIVVRRMRPSDISEVVRISLASFETDDAFRWLYPTHAASPSALYKWFLTQTKKRLAQDNCVAIVVEEESAAPFEQTAKIPRLIAFAFYSLNDLRSLGTEVPQIWPSRPLVYLERGLLALQVRYEGILDRVVIRERMAIFRGVEYQAFADLGPHVHLGLLAVDPIYQGRGVGLRMVQWATKKCQESGHVITLEASPMGKRTYLRAGFEIVEEKILDGEFGVEGVAMMWRPGGEHMVI